jgi:hypothetical protein
MSEDGKRVEPLITPEMRNQLAAIRKQYASKQTMIAECKVNVTAFIDGTIENWPNNIQDGIYAALERTSLGRGYTIVMSYCDIDYDNGGYFLHIVATGTKSIQ